MCNCCRAVGEKFVRQLVLKDRWRLTVVQTFIFHEVKMSTILVQDFNIISWKCLYCIDENYTLCVWIVECYYYLLLWPHYNSSCTSTYLNFIKRFFPIWNERYYLRGRSEIYPTTRIPLLNFWICLRVQSNII